MRRLSASTTFFATLVLPLAATADPVVAYLFTLRKDRHPLGRAWAAYFRGCPEGSWRVSVASSPCASLRPS